MSEVESSLEQRPRTTQDAYMEVSGRTTQEIKSSSCRGAVVEYDLIDLARFLIKNWDMKAVLEAHLSGSAPVSLLWADYPQPSPQRV